MPIKKGDLIELSKPIGDVTEFRPDESFETYFCKFNKVYINGKKANKKDTKTVLKRFRNKKGLKMLKDFLFKEIEKYKNHVFIIELEGGSRIFIDTDKDIIEFKEYCLDVYRPEKRFYYINYGEIIKVTN